MLRVRLALTGLEASSPILTALDLGPVKALFDLGLSAAGQAPKVIEISAELEVLDRSGRQIGAAVSTRKGDDTLPQGASITWYDLDRMVKFWANNFRKALDDARYQ